MPETNVVMSVRKASPTCSIIDIEGEMNGFVEDKLMQAYTDASGPSTRAIILNFTNMGYMNSSGIGLLVTLLIRVNRQRQRMLAYGLSDHYKHIFELTRLIDAIGIHDTEADALAAA